MGTLSTTMVRQNYNDGFKQASAIAGYDIDSTGQVTSVTTKEQYEMVKNLHQNQLRNAFQAVQNTNSLQVVGMKELLVGYGNTTFNWLTMNGDPSLVAKIEQLDTENLDKMIKGKIYSAKLGGVAGYYLWGGDANSSLLIKESEKT